MSPPEHKFATKLRPPTEDQLPIGPWHVGTARPKEIVPLAIWNEHNGQSGGTISSITATVSMSYPGAVYLVPADLDTSTILWTAGTQPPGVIDFKELISHGPVANYTATVHCSGQAAATAKLVIAYFASVEWLSCNAPPYIGTLACTLGLTPGAANKTVSASRAVAKGQFLRGATSSAKPHKSARHAKKAAGKLAVARKKAAAQALAAVQKWQHIQSSKSPPSPSH